MSERKRKRGWRMGRMGRWFPRVDDLAKFSKS